MTQQFDEAWAIASKLPEEQQNAIAAIVRQLASEESSTEAFSKLSELSGQKQQAEQLLPEVTDSHTQPNPIELPQRKIGEEKAQESKGEILTLEEIYRRYPNEWVLIVCPQLDEELNVIRGEVLAHSPNRDDAYNKLSLRKGEPLAIEYTGSAENVAFML